MCLCAGISPAAIAQRAIHPPTDSASLRVCNEKNYFGFGFFVSDVISGVVLGLFGPLHLALGPNRQMVVFRSSFY